MPISDIERALATGLDVDTAVNREALKYAVMRTIMCPRSGTCLDVRTAILITIQDGNGKTIHMECVHCDWWDVVRDTITAKCVERAWPLEILDGRVLNAPKRRARLKHEA